MTSPVKIFFVYAHEDEGLLNKLKSHLRPLQREGLIELWYDRDISAGIEWEQEIDKHLNKAQIILLLVSPDFMDSDYCYGIEMKKALKRHEQGEARVIPIILEYIDWQIEPLRKLQALPTDGRPIMGEDWHSQNKALFDVAKGIRKAVMEIVEHDLSQPKVAQQPVSPPQTLPQAEPKTMQAPNQPKQSSLEKTVQLPQQREPKQPAQAASPATVFPPMGTTLFTYNQFNGVKMIAWSPDSTRIASCGERLVQGWEITSHQNILNTTHCMDKVLDEKYRFQSFRIMVFSFDWSSDSTCLFITGLHEGRLEVWNVITESEIKSYQKSFHEIWQVTWSPDRKYLALRYEERIKRHQLNTYTESIYSVVVWNAAGSEVWRKSDSNKIDWSPDGRYVAIINESSMQVLNAINGETVITYPSGFYATVWSPDKTRIACSKDNYIYVWSLSDNINPLICYKRHIAGSRVHSIAWSPDGKCIASSTTWDNKVHVWNATTGEIIFIYEGNSSSEMRIIAWSPHGKCIASVHSASGNSDEVLVWQAV